MSNAYMCLRQALHVVLHRLEQSLKHQRRISNTTAIHYTDMDSNMHDFSDNKGFAPSESRDKHDTHLLTSTDIDSRQPAPCQWLAAYAQEHCAE